MSISRILSQGKGAMSANQTGLATASHNIANANTKGYSRQRVDMATNPSVDMGGNRVGTGVSIGRVSRTTDHFVNKRLEQESSDLGKMKAMNETFIQLEADLTNESESGISNRISQFFNDVRALSTEPASIPLRSAVKESANSVVSRFRNLNDNVRSMAADFDRRLEASVQEVNSLTKKISELNQQIISVEVKAGTIANDERDARDLAVRQLSELLPVEVADLENGGIMVTSKRIGVLADTSQNYELATVREEHPTLDSALQIRMKEHDGTFGKNVTKTITSGSLGGLLESRDMVLPDVKNRVDTLAFGFANALNSVHQQGYSLEGESGVKFFGDLSSAKDASALITVSDEVSEDLSKIAAGFSKEAKGDNRALLALADLEDAKIFEGGEANFTHYMTSLVGNVGVQSRSVQDTLDSQMGVMDQLVQLREQTSGVSLDEEAIEMLKFQKAFDANAKMIQVADTMMETVLSLKRF